ncbi:unnamed protein product [Echinostoma caproni]|uniref:Amyloid protein-binding protein 2 n=1 Tax=Echinostoma caproni TaxID=27848 RepID=A0A183AQZ0_9TREM|nr:unnamed protein product [Echinostoma caproni]
MPAISSTLAASSVNPPSSLVYLTKLVYDGVLHGVDEEKRLQNCFSRFSALSGLKSPRECERIFTEKSFERRVPLSTPYGVIDCCAISGRLKRNLIRRDPSLRQLCILTLAETGPPKMNINTLLSLPPNLFRMFLITAFSVHWIPMSHARFHKDSFEPPTLPSNLQCVFEFLSMPQVFERLFDECRDVLTFVVCWMQHAQFYSNDKGASSSSTDPIVSRLLFGLKIAHFLRDSSEYVHAVRTVRVTRGFLHMVSDEQTRLWLDHELYCIMLHSMNCHSMYLEPEDRIVFQKDVPRLIRSLHRANLLPCRPDPKRPSSYHILPIQCARSIADSIDGDSTPTTGNFLSSFRHTQPERNLDGSTLGNPTGHMLGPAGDSINSGTSGSVSPSLHEYGLNCGFLYAQLATYHYAMCSYEEAFQFSLLAIEQMRACPDSESRVSGHVVIDVLRILCKMCMIKRDYTLALSCIECGLRFTWYVCELNGSVFVMCPLLLLLKPVRFSLVSLLPVLCDVSFEHYSDCCFTCDF